MDSSAERSTHKVLELDLIAPDQIDKAQNEIREIFDGMGVCMTRAKLLLEQSGSNCSSLSREALVRALRLRQACCELRLATTYKEILSPIHVIEVIAVDQDVVYECQKIVKTIPASVLSITDMPPAAPSILTVASPALNADTVAVEAAAGVAANEDEPVAVVVGTSLEQAGGGQQLSGLKTAKEATEKEEEEEDEEPDEVPEPVAKRDEPLAAEKVAEVAEPVATNVEPPAVERDVAKKSEPPAAKKVTEPATNNVGPPSRSRTSYSGSSVQPLHEPMVVEPEFTNKLDSLLQCAINANGREQVPVQQPEALLCKMSIEMNVKGILSCANVEEYTAAVQNTKDQLAASAQLKDGYKKAVDKLTAHVASEVRGNQRAKKNEVAQKAKATIEAEKKKPVRRRRTS